MVWLFSVSTLILFITLLLKDAVASENVFFYVSRAEPACFVDEVVQTATLLVKYKHEDFKTKPLLVKLTLKGKLVKSESITTKDGRFAYAALETGMYRLCIEADDNRKSGMTFPVTGNAKLYVQTQVLANSVEDDVTSDMPPVAKTKQVVSLQQELSKVSDTVDLLLRKLQAARERETSFRDQSERINGRVVMWSIIQTLVLIVAGAFQSVHLHNFFLQKKIA